MGIRPTETSTGRLIDRALDAISLFVDGAFKCLKARCSMQSRFRETGGIILQKQGYTQTVRATTEIRTLGARARAVERGKRDGLCHDSATAHEEKTWKEKRKRKHAVQNDLGKDRKKDKNIYGLQ